ncbi:class I SAM-dependent methyltransferase [Candidatus Pelagibacter sp.]|uniref:class I SAM-dependent methyltransferase n=1 Tax=Candidatus Pelagibacter sp. TaxID=2024849 RepID=UPI003F825744
MINFQIKHELKNFLLSYKNNKVLDFGCGDARYKKIIRENNEYIGVDFKKTGYENSKKIADYYWDNKTLPFEDEKFDVIVCTEVLDDVEDIELVTHELRRVLKKDGKIFITMPFIFGEHDTPYDFRRFTSFGIKKFFEKQNFNIVEYKKLLQGKNTVIQIISSEFFRYINNPINKNYKLIIFLGLYAILATIRLLFWFLPSNIFKNIHISNLVILEKKT